MSRSILLPALLLLGLHAAQSYAAEDHSAHQPVKPATSGEDHSHHQGHSPAAEPSKHADHSQHGEHAQTPDQPTESERNHVPPPPPEHPMHDMSNEEMIELMQMDDASAFGMLLLDQIEWRDTEEGDALAWDVAGWYGTDYDKLWLKSEGERSDDDSDARVELLWDHVMGRWWDVQAGLRHDFGEGPSRTWAAFGVQGLAPHWFEVEATAYIGAEGRTAARFSGEYELLLTQRLILQPELEFELYGKDDPGNGIGSGLAEVELALRLRYEIRRELAPYIGMVWTRAYGDTADLARAAGHDVDNLQLTAGMRIWF